MKFKLLFLLFLLFEYSQLWANDYVVKSKGILNVDKGIIESGNYIYVKNGIIKSISKDFTPKGFELIDLSNQYLVPGLIDCHTHLFMTQTITDIHFEDALVREAKLPDSSRNLRAKTFLTQYINEGFTSLCDLGNSGHFLDAKLKEEIKDRKDFPNFFISGPGLAVNKGQFRKDAPMELVKKEYTIIDNNSDIDDILEQYLKNNVDILKIYLDNSPGLGKLSNTILKKIMNSKGKNKFKKITFHSIEPIPSQLINDFKIDSIEHFNYFNSHYKTDSLKFATITDIDESTLKEFNYYNKVSYLSQNFRTKALLKSNINLVFGPDFYFHSDALGFNRGKHVKKSIEALSEAGLTPIEILQTLTINAAKSLKMENKIGSIAEGSEASFMALKDNPLVKIEAIQEINFLMNRGEILIQRPLR